MYEELHLLDWAVIAAYFLAAIAIGLYFSPRVKDGNIVDYFVAGRKMTWFMAGTSLVATSFAADTPLVISGWIRTLGLQQNWFWWGGIMGMMLCTFFYARLWNRARIITDVEFVELRYKGNAAAILRGFHASYKSLIQNTLVLSWVTLAAAKIMEVVLDIPTIVIMKNFTVRLVESGVVVSSVINPDLVFFSIDEKLSGVLLCMITTLGYTTVSGLWGVIATDCFQFIFAMSGCIVLAAVVLINAGGPTIMVQKAIDAVNSGIVDNGITKFAVNSRDICAFSPPFDFRHGGFLALWAFIVFIGLQWWGGGEGGGYLAQRLFSCKNEKHSVGAMLWFNFTNYALRPWPWIIVGVGSLYMLPKISEYGSHYNQEYAYVIMLMKYLPVGLKGMMVAALMAAYMSTVSTHVNFGASYLVNDLYKRFFVTNATQKHYIRISEIAVIGLTIFSGVFAYYQESIAGGWLTFFELISGTGFVVLLRWYWWRINAWSEISAMLSSLIVWNILNKEWLLGSYFGAGNPEMFEKMYAVRFSINLILSTIIWITVTFLTKPVDEAHLIEFYKRVRPAGFWKDIPSKAGNPNHLHIGRAEWIGWATGTLSLFAMIFSLGKLSFGMYGQSLVYGIFAIITAFIMFLILKKIDWTSISDFAKETE